MCCLALLTKDVAGVIFIVAEMGQPIAGGEQGEVSEWSKEAVLKTVVGQLTGGSNPSLSERKVL